MSQYFLWIWTEAEQIPLQNSLISRCLLFKLLDQNTRLPLSPRESPFTTTHYWPPFIPVSCSVYHSLWLDLGKIYCLVIHSESIGNRLYLTLKTVSYAEKYCLVRWTDVLFHRYSLVDASLEVKEKSCVLWFRENCSIIAILVIDKYSYRWWGTNFLLLIKLRVILNWVVRSRKDVKSHFPLHYSAVASYQL